MISTIPRKICVITSTRADYGLLRNLLTALQHKTTISTQLLVTGTHLSKKHGYTVEEIRQDGFEIQAEVPITLEVTSPLSTAQAAASALSEIAKALHQLKPDIVVLLGDRYEIASAAYAALYLQIPIAHLHGGERSEGVIDEALRHSITKTAYWHFCASEEYRQRIIQLGEAPQRVFNVGALGLDSIKRLKLWDKQKLENSLALSLQGPVFVVTYHPVSTSEQSTRTEINALCDALCAYPEATIIVTGVNADTGADIVRVAFENLQSQLTTQRFLMVESLGQTRYLSLLAHADIVIGNSSSGIIEAPFMKVPTVNIGDRQRGRLKGRSQIDCQGRSDEISNAISKALSSDFLRTAFDTPPPLGDGTSAPKIAEILEKTPLSKDCLTKSFYDIPFQDRYSEGSL
ncbi:UDP-N-acetylglucosamine 2-epimerase [Terasakiella pusilla]|uniref:UDP-N-acetylglucosamine 2-epimerase n=1 Tax=Terasakiella pusilla TaxID=64973 RepID=UPI00068AEB58|nr:UDP-N-acetylglucosamine 2-epimerase [Terasakiella pusilla]